MDIQDFLGISVVGAALSFLVQDIKIRLGTDSVRTKLVVIALSTVVGSVYWFLRDTVLWQTILGILAAASTVYAILLKSE